MGPDNRWVWRRRGDYPNERFAPIDKFAKISIYVWGEIGIRYKSSLIVFTRNVNSTIYIHNLFEAGFLAVVDEYYGERAWFLIQDRAPCHTNAASLATLTELCNIFPVWPANSPDLNPIETL
jgi:hypothetical protein